jgi:hypothetical protein
MTMGEKLFEEKGTTTMTFIKEVKEDGIIIKQSFNSDVKGFGKFPSGKNMGSGGFWMMPDGKTKGRWRGILMTQDNQMIVWKGMGHSMRTMDKVKGIMVMTFMTKAEKYAWMNTIIVVADLQGDLMSFTDVGYEWK